MGKKPKSSKDKVESGMKSYTKKSRAERDAKAKAKQKSVGKKKRAARRR